MIQKKLNSSNRVHSSLLLYVTCIISVLTINLVNMGRGFGMEQQQRQQVDLDQLIRESVQQNHIEGYVIEDLKTIPGNEIFDEEFREILSDAFSRRRERAFLNEDSLKQQGDLAKLFVSFNSTVLDTLKNNPEISTKFIRQLMDLEQSDKEIFEENQLFLTRLNQMFYQSKQLLNFVSLPEIAKIYIENPMAKFNKIKFTGKQIEIEQTTKVSKEVLQTQVCEISLNRKRYLLHSASKSNGKHFGTIVRSYIFEPEVRQALKVSGEKTYFLKSYSMGYPAINNNRGSNGAAYDTTKDITSYDKDNIKVKLPDLRELMGYKILEHLSLGPKTHFIINPYITYGLFILTEGLNNNGQQFVEENHFAIEQNEELEKNVLDRYFGCKNFKDYKAFYPVISLTELHLTSLIFNLVDMKQDNIGYIKKESFDNKDGSEEDDFYANDKEWFIIDFLVNRNASLKLEDSFLDGNFFHDVESRDSVAARLLCANKRDLDDKRRKFYFGYRALRQFNDRLIEYGKENKLFEEQQPEQNPNDLKLKQDIVEGIQQREEQDDRESLILRHLLQQQSKRIKDLMNTERGKSEDEIMLRYPEENGVERKRNRTNAELIGFKKNDNVPIHNEHNLDNLGDRAIKLEADEKKEEQLQYLDNAFRDLDVYSKSIVQNYRKLKAFISNGRDEYFGKNDELMPEAKQQITQKRTVIQPIPQPPLLQTNSQQLDHQLPPPPPLSQQMQQAQQQQRQSLASRLQERILQMQMRRLQLQND